MAKARSETTEPAEGTAPAVRRMPERVESLTLEEPFDGWTIQANRAFTVGELEDLASNLVYRMLPVLRRLVKDWDFVDRDGKAIPFTAAGWQELSLDLLNEMTRKICGWVKVPKA